MMPSYPQRSPTNRFVLPITLALVAAIGWGLLLVSRQSAAEFEAHLRRQVSNLHQRQLELLDEKARTEGAVGSLEKHRSEIATLGKEVDGLKQARQQVQADLTGLRVQRDASSRQPQSAQGEMASPSSVRQVPEHASIVASQRTLTKLGYGPLVLDGIIGPGTRQAIEDFQDDHGMQVTSELDSATMRQLNNSNTAATLE